jgi:hypothetical protein
MTNANVIRTASSGAISAAPTKPEEKPAINGTVPSSQSKLHRILLGAILVGMLVGGITMRLLKDRFFPSATDNANVSPPTIHPLVTNEERLGREIAEQYTDPKVSEAHVLKKGIEAWVDLAAYYLKKGRIDDAEKVFRDLADRNYHDKPPNSQEHPYRVLGRLGLAIMLSWHDKPKESLDRLAKMLPEPQPPGGGVFVLGIPNIFLADNVELRRLVAEALDRNAKNLKTEKLDRPYLDALRKPPAMSMEPKQPFKKDKP